MIIDWLKLLHPRYNYLNGTIKAKERIRELERSLESLQQKLGEQEDKSNKLYLHMYSKEQEAGPSQVSVCNILRNWNDLKSSF